MNIPSSDSTFSIQNQLWRLPILLLLVVVFAAGFYALKVWYRRIHVGDLSPAADAFISYIYSDDGANLATLITEVRDARTGKLIHTIPHERPVAGDLLHWSPDGQRLVGQGTSLDAPQQLVEYDLSSTRSTVLRRETIQADDVQTVFCNAVGRVIHVENHTRQPNGERPYLRIVEENETELARVEYGRDEEAYARPERDGVILNVTFRPHQKAAPNGDFVYSDGIRASLMRLDSTTGEQVHLVKGKFYIPVQNSLRHIAIMDANGDASIVEISKETEVLRTIKSKAGFLLLDDDRLVAWNWDFPGPISVYSLTTEDVRDFEIDSMSNIAASGDGNVLIATQDGRLTKLDSSTGQTRELLNFRPWFNLCRWTAIFGLPLFCLAWLTMAWGRHPSWPILEIGSVYLIVTLVLMVWSRQAAYTESEDVMGFLILALLGTLMPLLLVWVSTFDSIWGQGLPIGLVGVACVFTLFMAWNTSNGRTEFVFAGALLIFWQTLGIALFRWHYGGLVNRNAEATPPVKQTQVTIKELVVAMAAFAVLFSCLRFAGWSKVEFRVAFVNWLLTYTLTYSFVVLVAIWAAFCVRNFFLALIGCLTISIPALAGHCYLAMKWPRLAPGFHPLQWYFQAFFAGLLLFAALRYCRAHSYGVARFAGRQVV